MNLTLFSSRLAFFVLRRLLREFLDLEHAQLFRLFESFASLFDHFVSQVLAGVMLLRIDSGIQPLLGCLDPFIDAVEGTMRVRRQGWLVAFRHGVSS
jgi:hypothetical protein